MTVPHCGYHWRGQSPFFEGWYVRLLLPDTGQTFAFMYAIENPQGDRPYGGGSVQILGPPDRLQYRIFPSTKTFWASSHTWELGQSSLGRPVDPSMFFDQVDNGYQIYRHWHQGHIPLPDSSCRWSFNITPRHTWGTLGRPVQATGGWLSFLPIFDPGWQILLAQGEAQGWIDWQGQRYVFDRALVYAEKNWGTSFPTTWLWIQHHHFPANPSLSVTAAVGVREACPWHRQVGLYRETVGLIGIHYQGRFYEFAPWTAQVTWDTPHWGRWSMVGISANHWVELRGTTDDPGTWVFVPTAQGLQRHCRDTVNGHLHLRLGHHLRGLITEGHSTTAALELGGAWARP